MIRAGQNGTFCRTYACFRFDQVEGKPNIFYGRGRLILYAKLLGGDALFRQPVEHTGSLADALMIALPTGQNCDGVRMLLQIFFCRCQPFPKRAARSGSVDAGTQNNQIVRFSVLRTASGADDHKSDDSGGKKDRNQKNPECRMHEAHQPRKTFFQHIDETEQEEQRTHAKQNESAEAVAVDEQVYYNSDHCQNQRRQPISLFHQKRYPFSTFSVFSTPSL